MANKLISWKEMLQEGASVIARAVLDEKALQMFIEGQMNWERPEFDEHG